MLRALTGVYMRLNDGAIELGIQVDREDGLEVAVDEVGKLERVFGDSLAETVDKLVAGKRQGCEAPNCCFDIEILHGVVEIPRTYRQDIEQEEAGDTIPVTSLAPQCSKRGRRGCKTVVDSAADSLFSVVKSAGRAYDSGEEKAEEILIPADAEITLIHEKAQTEAGAIAARASVQAQEARTDEYASVRQRLADMAPDAWARNLT